MKRLLVIFTSIAIVGCSYYPVTVTQALKFAGDNKLELENVLEYYKDDPVKYKAAVFLIENMA